MQARRPCTTHMLQTLGSRVKRRSIFSDLENRGDGSRQTHKSATITPENEGSGIALSRQRWQWFEIAEPYTRSHLSYIHAPLVIKEEQ